MFSWVTHLVQMLCRRNNPLTPRYRRISPDGIKLLKDFEGCRLLAYADVGGVLTIGYGHTGIDVIRGQPISAERAEQLLREDLARFEQGVEKSVTLILNKFQFDALVMLTYNIGMTAFQRSTLLIRLNEGNIPAVRQQWVRWDKVNGKSVAGLTTRRLRELAWFLKEDTA